MSKSIKHIFVCILFFISLNVIAQTKYQFKSTSTRWAETHKEFKGQSHNRNVSIKWNKDIWLSSSSYGIDRISDDGFIEINDQYKGQRYVLKITPSETSLVFSFNKNEELSSFDAENNPWYQSILEEVVYPYLKATFHNRFYRESHELITVQVGSKFPDFDKLDLNKNRITNEDIKNKITVINFWHVYCGPCIQEMPDLNELVAKYNDSEKYRFIAFSVSSNKQITKLFKKKNIRFDYQQIPNSRDVEKMLGLVFNPVSFILDSDGTIIYMEVGYTAENIAQMDEILEEAGKKMPK